MHPSASIEQVKFAAVSMAEVSASGINIVAAVSGKRLRVLAYLLVSIATDTVRFRTATTNITGIMTVIEGRPLVGRFTPTGLMQTVAGDPLNIRSAGGNQLSGFVVYMEV